MDLVERLSPRAMLIAAVGAGILFQLLLGASYVAASLDPAGSSVGLPVAVVVLDEGDRGRELLAALEATDSPIAWIEMDSRESAYDSLRAKDAFGALVVPANFSGNLESFGGPSPRSAWVEVFANPGASTSGNIAAARAIAAALDALRAEARERMIGALDANDLGVLLMSEGQARMLAEPVHVASATVNPVHAKGSNGLAPTYLAMACWIGGYIGAVALERFRPFTRLAAHRRAMLVAGAALLQGVLLAGFVAAVGLDMPDFAELALVLAVGTWMAYGVVGLLTDLFGLAGVAPAFAVLAIGLPASGAIYPVEMLPSFFRALHGVSPFTWLVEGLRTSIYARGAGDLALHLLKLAGLAGAATVASLVWARTRQAGPNKAI